MSDRWWSLTLAAIGVAVFVRLAWLSGGAGYWPSLLDMLAAWPLAAAWAVVVMVGVLAAVVVGLAAHGRPDA